MNANIMDAATENGTQPVAPQAANPQDLAIPAEDAEEVKFLKKLNTARDLIKHLRILFGKISKSDKKYADPTDVLRSLTDDCGRPFEIGNERDIGEFNDTFLSRV